MKLKRIDMDLRNNPGEYGVSEAKTKFFTKVMKRSWGTK